MITCVVLLAKLIALAIMATLIVAVVKMTRGSPRRTAALILAFATLLGALPAVLRAFNV